MKALTHADSVITCVISSPVITSAPSAKRFLAELQSARHATVGVTLTSIRAVADQDRLLSLNQKDTLRPRR